MILLDREDVDRIGLTGYWFYHRWVPDDPEAVACDYAEIPAKGPFLMVVNDEEAWMKRDEGDQWHRIGKRFRYPCVEQEEWSALFDLYAEGIGISSATLRNRFAGMQRRMRKNTDVWVPWDQVYTWPEGSDHVWASLIFHFRWRTRERDGVREVLYVGR